MSNSSHITMRAKTCGGEGGPVANLPVFPTQLLRLSGPEELANAAQQVWDTERKLRDLKKAPEDNVSAGRDGMPQTVSDAREELAAAG
jgi:hypothetical protein